MTLASRWDLDYDQRRDEMIETKIYLAAYLIKKEGEKMIIISGDQNEHGKKRE